MFSQINTAKQWFAKNKQMAAELVYVRDPRFIINPTYGFHIDCVALGYISPMWDLRCACCAPWDKVMNQNSNGHFCARKIDIMWIAVPHFNVLDTYLAILASRIGISQVGNTNTKLLLPSDNLTKHTFVNSVSLQWRHNGGDSVSNHQPHATITTYKMLLIHHVIHAHEFQPRSPYPYRSKRKYKSVSLVSQNISAHICFHLI